MARYFDAVIFDLDGVVTQTAKVHARAWKTLFDDYLKQRESRFGEPFHPFDMAKDYLEYVDGRPRYEGTRSFLESRGIFLPFGSPSDKPDQETIHALGNIKDRLFSQALQDQGVETYVSTVELIQQLKVAGSRIAIVSSSKHCHEVQVAARLDKTFDVHVDGIVSEQLGLKGKPEADIFLKSAEMFALKHERAVVMEDAGSGVQAGRNGKFGLVSGIDRHNNPNALLNNGADRVVNDLSEVNIEQIDDWVEYKKNSSPSALAVIDTIAALFNDRRPVVFLDYDGTLTPIVARPDLALLSDGMRNTLRCLAQHYTTAIISGRALDDVRQLVALDDIYYAGNHGLEIAGPGSTQIKYEKGLAFVEAVDKAYREILPQVEDIEGVLVEHKKYSLSVHYRLVDKERVTEIEQIVDTLLAQQPELKKHLGKKVFEIRPCIDWDKGKALLWLLKTLGLEGEDILPVYIGDDVTDEDAFRVLQDRGIGILVTEGSGETAASHILRNTEEVKDFLDKCVQLAEGEHKWASGN